MNVKTIGMIIIIFCCAGSMPALGVIFCCQNWLAPMITGVM